MQWLLLTSSMTKPSTIRNVKLASCSKTQTSSVVLHNAKPSNSLTWTPSASVCPPPLQRWTLQLINVFVLLDPTWKWRLLAIQATHASAMLSTILCSSLLWSAWSGLALNSQIQIPSKGVFALQTIKLCPSLPSFAFPISPLIQLLKAYPRFSLVLSLKLLTAQLDKFRC